MEKFYQTMLSYVHHTRYLKKIIRYSNKILPVFMFGLYPCVLIDLWFMQRSFFFPAFMKPLIAFVLVTIFRKIINRKRPYETMNIEPLVQHKQGESFPSRHTLSAFIIALVCFYVHDILGIIAMIVATMISVGRILSGVHYISDVVSAIIIAGIVFFI